MARRSGLGKGLDSIIPTTAPDDDLGGAGALTAGAAFTDIPLDAIRANPYQPRQEFEDDALHALADSVRELGVLQPILVRRVPDGYELVAGERRFRAAQIVGLATVPALVRDLADQTSLEQALVENVQREDLLPLEEAAAYRQLVDEFGLTQETVARRVGKSRPAISNCMRLLTLPSGVQQLLQEQRIEAGHARALLGLSDHEAQLLLAETAARNGWSVRQVETRVRLLQGSESDALPKRAKSARSAERPAAVLEVEELLSDRLATRVSVTMTAAGRGRITIDFGGMDDLQRIFEALEGK